MTPPNALDAMREQFRQLFTTAHWEPATSGIPDGAQGMLLACVMNIVGQHALASEAAHLALEKKLIKKADDLMQERDAALASEAALERIDKRMEKLFEDACAHQSPNAIHYAGEAMKIVTDERRVLASPSGQPALVDEQWPEESYDDPRCECSQLDNHMDCPIHGMDSDNVLRTVQQWREYKPTTDALAELLRAEFVKGFELAHELQLCGHSRGDCRDPNYKSGDEFCESKCIGCEREAALKAEVRIEEAEWLRDRAQITVLGDGDWGWVDEHIAELRAAFAASPAVTRDSK